MQPCLPIVLKDWDGALYSWLQVAQKHLLGNPRLLVKLKQLIIVSNGVRKCTRRTSCMSPIMVHSCKESLNTAYALPLKSKTSSLSSAS
jgi:hypothetical protein